MKIIKIDITENALKAIYIIVVGLVVALAVYGLCFGTV